MIPAAASLILFPLAETLIKGVGQHVLSDGDALKYLNFGANLIGAYGEASAEIQELTAFVQRLVDEKRAATAEEWAEWEARSDAAHSRIQAVDASTRS